MPGRFGPRWRCLCGVREDRHPESASAEEPRGPFEDEKQAKGEEKSNRNNATFKNRRNLMSPNDITFSNRDRNTTSASPHFRPPRSQSEDTRHQRSRANVAPPFKAALEFAGANAKMPGVKPGATNNGGLRVAEFSLVAFPFAFQLREQSAKGLLGVQGFQKRIVAKCRKVGQPLGPGAVRQRRRCRA